MNLIGIEREISLKLVLIMKNKAFLLNFIQFANRNTIYLLFAQSANFCTILIITLPLKPYNHLPPLSIFVRQYHFLLNRHRSTVILLWALSSIIISSLTLTIHERLLYPVISRHCSALKLIFQHEFLFWC